ncbi:MAG: CBU_0585 family protein [Legionellales bacterium]
MNTKNIDKAYVSPIDKFLFEYDATHEKTASQIQEIKKNQRIALMRDDKEYKDSKGAIWESF